MFMQKNQGMNMQLSRMKKNEKEKVNKRVGLHVRKDVSQPRWIRYDQSQMI